MSDTDSTNGTKDLDEGLSEGPNEDLEEITEARVGALRPSLELLWGTDERPARGPKRGLSLEAVVDAAVRLADAEGLDTLSMRRLASELGTGTMSLYRYVPGKTELLDLMLDRVQSDLIEAHNPAEATDWQGAVSAIAHGTLELHRRHPWLLKVNQSRALLGPRSLNTLEASLKGLRAMTGFTDPELLSVILAVNSFAAGTARMEIEATEAVDETGLDHDSFWAGQQPYLERAMLSGDYPAMAALSEDTFDPSFDHFAFGLERLIDGFAVLVERRAGS
ncbi:TetR/AcrR family transcriptional regulator [Streptomyces sp. NBC_00237]|uniref:TetR/AcrR family transcriptional regulator n=1 Tax=Streptomyces sp. NBC_00237 TaxID=2975687 RepID=UPI002256BB98|nr:TetR/AcrR family transcriptional regulator [Streptomyces sp. NBC_00237]MCX5200498.1 TetR/AcrR family transcriptional regulator [Streptomyces sp. NBC_00237]